VRKAGLGRTGRAKTAELKEVVEVIGEAVQAGAQRSEVRLGKSTCRHLG